MFLNMIGARESQSSDFAQRERAMEEEEDAAPMENFHGTPPFQTGGSREVVDSAAMSWEEGSIAFQNRSRRGRKPQQGWWSNHMKASSKKLLAGLASVSSNQPSTKKVDVSSHVLETYHDSFLYGRVPLAVKIRAGLRGGFIGYMWHILEFTAALVSGVLYVYSTYDRNSANTWIAKAQNIISIVFVVDYILRIYSAPVRLLYIFSIWGFLDLISAIPIILLFRKARKGASIIRLLQFLRIIRILTLMRKVGIAGSTISQQILLLVVSTFGVVFLIAGLLQWVEYDGAPQAEKNLCPGGPCINFWDAFYFIIVTISTVGYGDITPKTQLGQLVAMGTILLALVVLPIQIGHITYLASRRPYGGSMSGRKVINSRYLIVSGSISFRTIQECLAEFFNPTHCEDLESYPLRVTILAPFSPSFELKSLLSLYDGMAKFIEGSPVRQSDLERCSADHAHAFFLLADPEAEDSKMEDSAQIVKALAVHRFCGDKVRVIVEVLEPETQTSTVWDETRKGGIEIICPVKIHYKMIARSCLVKGLYTFITNLFTSEIKIQGLPKHSFMHEYFHSFDNEVYPMILPKAFHDMLFEEVVEFVFTTFNVVLFALDVHVLHEEQHHTHQKVLLHPKGHCIQPDDIGLIIAWDLHTAYAISKFNDEQLTDRILCSRGRRRRSKYDQTVELQKFHTRPNAADNKNLKEEEVDGRLNHELVFPNSPDGRYKLESKLRSAIFSTYDNHKPQHDDTVEFGTITGGSGADDDDEHSVGSSSSRSAVDGCYPKGMSLEKATEILLAWPPIPYHGQPHPAVLERRADIILQNLKQCTIQVVESKVPHILVCIQGNWPRHIFYFLRELRKPGFPNPPIVILHPNEPDAKEWGKVGIFDDTFFLKGSAIYELDLMRGGVLQAEKVVILADHGQPVDLSGEGVEGGRTGGKTASAYSSDVDNIVIAANVDRLVGEKKEIMVVEMQQTISFYYLRPQFAVHRNQVNKSDYKRNRDALLYFGPPYMEGKAVSQMLLGYLLRASFYNRNTLSIVDQLLEGGHVKQHGGGVSSERLRILEQIPIPEQYHNQEYSDVFTGLLHDRGILALGLYRACGTLGAPCSYVFTNPPKETIVNPADLVYVLV
ncbi:unnamed protein product [Sphagnum troendelagicum]|uniref:Uncharacterized protein n=1 Tax=Sphagnum troendelagicum TaxID=128251 RepID=A0ABP0TQE0_9BRYO